MREKWGKKAVLDSAYIHYCLPQYFFSCTTIVKTIDSGERRIKSVAMASINPGKEFWPCWGSNQRPPVLKSCKLLTKLHGPGEPIKKI